MKKIYYILPILLFVAPYFSFAHGMAGFSDAKSGADMMRYVEDMGMGGSLHEEMESLMAKMVEGNLNEQEASRMSEIIKQYPGPSGMMSGRMMGSGALGEKLWQNSSTDKDSVQGYNMMKWGVMGGGWFGFWSFVGMLGILIWLTVGILATVWLWRQISRKQTA